jgi:hypothetical protein
MAATGIDRDLAVFRLFDGEIQAFENLARDHAHDLRVIDDKALLH